MARIYFCCRARTHNILLSLLIFKKGAVVQRSTRKEASRAASTPLLPHSLRLRPTKSLGLGGTHLSVVAPGGSLEEEALICAAARVCMLWSFGFLPPGFFFTFTMHPPYPRIF